MENIASSTLYEILSTIVSYKYTGTALIRMRLEKIISMAVCRIVTCVEREN